MLMNFTFFEPMTAPRPPRPLERRLSIGIHDGKVGGAHFHFACRSDGDDRLLAFESVRQCFDNVVIALADQIGLFGNGDTVRRDCQAVPFVIFGLPFDNQRLASAAGKKLRRSTAGV